MEVSSQGETETVSEEGASTASPAIGTGAVCIGRRRRREYGRDGVKPRTSDRRQRECGLGWRGFGGGPSAGAVTLTGKGSK